MDILPDKGISVFKYCQPRPRHLFRRTNSHSEDMRFPPTNTTHLYSSHMFTLWSAASVPGNICLYLEPPPLQHTVTQLEQPQRGGINLPRLIAKAEKQLDSSQKARTALYIDLQLPIIPLMDLTITQGSPHPAAYSCVCRNQDMCSHIIP